MVAASEKNFSSQRRKGAKKAFLETRQRFAPLRLCEVDLPKI